jgi:hypothetical protein
MSPEAWGFFSVLTTVCSGVLIELIRMRRRLDAQPVPEDDGDIEDEDTPRGFRTSVLISLRELRNGMADLRRRQERFDRHLDDHAAADVRRPERRH